MNARLSFDAELESLSASLIRMGALATDAIDKAIEALEANDGALAQSVIAGDRNIDDMERSIEHQCLTLLLRLSLIHIYCFEKDIVCAAAAAAPVLSVHGFSPFFRKKFSRLLMSMIKQNSTSAMLNSACFCRPLA